MFYTLQGEGAQSGRAAVFCRFSGCNLWSGLERDREKSACPFCDTDFVGVNGPGGGKYSSAKVVADAIKALWPAAITTKQVPYVVFTGGEPLLQLDEALVTELHSVGFEVAVETNGSLEAPKGIDWLCVSPKDQMELKITRGDELKLLYPQQALPPEKFNSLNFKHFFLQPIDNKITDDNIAKTVEYCLLHPQWRISMQIHKILHID